MEVPDQVPPLKVSRSGSSTASGSSSPTAAGGGSPSPTRYATRGAQKRRGVELGCRLADVQDDVVLHIFSFVDARTLWCFLHASHRLHRIAAEDVLWRTLLLAQLGGDESLLPRVAPSEGSGGWRGRFFRWQSLESCTTFTPPRAPPRADMLEVAPTARFLHRAACLSDRWLYVFGGRGAHTEFNDLWVLDKQSALLERPAPSATAGPATPAPTPPSAAWRRVHARTPPPPQRQSATLTAVGSQLLMFGGRQGDTTFLNDAWAFDTASSSWTCLRESDEIPLPAPPSLDNPVRPSPRWAHTAVAFGASVLIFGTCFADLHWFDFRTLAWRRQASTAGPAPAARSGHSACAAASGASMLVFGGNTTKASFDDLWEFAVASATWRQVRAAGGSPPSGRVGHTLCAMGSRLLVLGGREYSTNLFDSRLHAFHFQTRRWSEVVLSARRGDAREASGGTVLVRSALRTGHCATLHAGKLLLFGGLNDRNEMLDDLTSVDLIS